MTTPKLIFVYNADSGLTNALLDVGTRIFAPEKYPCTLCAVTYGPFGKKDQWKKFINTLPYPVEFLHKDDFEKAYSHPKNGYPALFIDDGKLTQLMGSEEFSDIKTLEDLKQAVSKAATN
jgi:hypothetical protein